MGNLKSIIERIIHEEENPNYEKCKKEFYKIINSEFKQISQQLNKKLIDVCNKYDKKGKAMLAQIIKDEDERNRFDVNIANLLNGKSLTIG